MKTGLKNVFFIIFLCVLGFSQLTCSQDPLFYDIYTEYPPIDPLIKGVPTRIVDAGNGTAGKLYVANANGLFEYEYTAGGTNQWAGLGKRCPDQIKAIAYANAKLYILNSAGALYEFVSAASWTEVTSVPGAQQIFGATDKLFIGNGSAVYDFNVGSPTLVSGPSGLLSGAVKISSVYYVSTNTGLWNTASATALKADRIAGIIANPSVTPTELIAVTPSRMIYRNAGGVGPGGQEGTVSPSWDMTGALALWPASSPTTLLVGLGGQSGDNSSGTYRYGYRELDLTGNRTAEPGDDSGGRATSIVPDKRYSSDIGKYPVNALAVIPNSNSGDDANRPIVVASTQQKGLWSYKTRRGSPQWNGEDNSN